MVYTFCGEGAYHGSFRLDTLGRNIHLQRVRLGVLWVAKVQDLVKQLIDQHEVVLDGLLVELAKVGLAQRNQTIYKLEDQSGIGVALGNGNQVDILVLDMAEGGGAEGEDGRAHLGIRYNLDAEDVGEARAAVIAEGAENQILALLIENEDAGEHGGGV
jgi:hypothetical protein